MMAMTMNRKEIARLNRCIAKAVSGFTPPENLTVTEWAEHYRRLSSESSAEPGLWRTARTPYLRDVMNAFTDPKVRHITMVAASQVGKSECELNIIGYIIDQDPGSILFIHPTTIDAKEFSKLRIAPMIRDCPSLRRKVVVPKSRDSGNTLLQKTYPGGILTLCGSTEAHSLASKPIRYVIGDERDRWAASAGTEGDPWDLAMARQTTFYNAKAVEVSTPTIKSASAIEKSFNKGSMERWKSQCPHCGKFHEIRWEDIRYEYETTEIKREKTYKVTSVSYICPECACVSDEITMKRQPARWEPDNPSAMEQGIRSFWLNAFVSQWAGWSSIVLKFLDAIGSSRKMQVVYNTCFGQLWEDRGDLEDEDSLLARREDYGRRDDDSNNLRGESAPGGIPGKNPGVSGGASGGIFSGNPGGNPATDPAAKSQIAALIAQFGNDVELPEGVLVLTCGVDTQNDRLEFEILGHGHFGETWGIRYGVIRGRPDDPDTWRQLDDVISHVYRFRDGLGLRVSMTFVDEGGLFTQNVRLACQRRIGQKVFCIKGLDGPNRPYTSPPKQMKIIMNQKVVGSCWQYQLGVDSGKQIIMDNLRVQSPGAKFCHFPRRDDYGPAYFTGLLSERLEYDPEKKQPWSWKKLPGHMRNEPLDCRNYALAAFKALSADLDAIDQRIKQARGTAPPPPASRQTKTAAPRKRVRRSAVDKLFDTW